MTERGPDAGWTFGAAVERGCLRVLALGLEALEVDVAGFGPAYPPGTGEGRARTVLTQGVGWFAIGAALSDQCVDVERTPVFTPVEAQHRPEAHGHLVRPRLLELGVRPHLFIGGALAVARFRTDIRASRLTAELAQHLPGASRDVAEVHAVADAVSRSVDVVAGYLP
jgi:hypothetical protein